MTEKHNTPFAVVPRQAIFDQELSNTTFKIFTILCALADKKHQCFPSWKYLEDATGVSEATISRSIRKLEDLGYVIVHKRRRENGSRTSNFYTVVFQDITTLHTDALPCTDARQQPCMNDTPITIPASLPNKKNKQKKKPVKITLQDWEEIFGQLVINMMDTWVGQNNLDEKKVIGEIEDFRTKCKAKGYVYVDFVAAFQTWLRNDNYGKPFDWYKRKVTAQASADDIWAKIDN